MAVAIAQNMKMILLSVRTGKNANSYIKFCIAFISLDLKDRHEKKERAQSNEAFEGTAKNLTQTYTERARIS